VGSRLWRYRASIRISNSLRDCRKGIRNFRKHAGCGPEGPRAIELRMVRANVAKLGDGIADGAQEVIER
jgi:hypothetical protein